jgi:hypothetical protein
MMLLEHADGIAQTMACTSILYDCREGDPGSCSHCGLKPFFCANRGYAIHGKSMRKAL